MLNNRVVGPIHYFPVEPDESPLDQLLGPVTRIIKAGCHDGIEPTRGNGRRHRLPLLDRCKSRRQIRRQPLDLDPADMLDLTPQELGHLIGHHDLPALAIGNDVTERLPTESLTDQGSHNLPVVQLGKLSRIINCQ